MEIISMSELEAMYGGGDGTPLSLEDMGISKIALHSIMMYEVADLVEEILDKHIRDDIYSAYSPKTTYYGNRPPVGWLPVGGGYYRYGTRFSLAGNYIRKMMGDTLFVTSDALPNTSVTGQGWSHNVGGFLQMVGTNPGAAWKGRFARPALQNAQADVDNNPTIRRAIEAAFTRGLKRFTG